MDLTLLNSMRHSAGAGHRSGDRQGCLKGTRKDVLLQLERWLISEQDQRVFWLNGLAGTGKSTIAQTFAEMSFADGRLGASFFCSRGYEDRSNLRAIFPTLAFQLAYRYPSFRGELLQVLRANPDVGQETLCSQMERLIICPLKTTRISTLIIIDALDECKDEEPASAILSILSRYTEQIPYVKFFITGRPEPRIRSGFRLAALRPITEVLKLHNVRRALVDTDIRLFFQMRLAEIAKNRSHCDVTEDWPIPSDITILCEKTAGLFIYASTVVKFVASRHHEPPNRLALLISLPQNTTQEGESGIDILYTEILKQAYCDIGPGNQKSDIQEVYCHFRSVVGAVLLALNPLSMKSLSSLLYGTDTPSKISTALNSLHSLILVPEGTEDPIHVFHKSFPDFLMDPKRCQDTRFFVDPSVHHLELLLSCLHLMEVRLKRNLCNLEDYAVLRNLGDLSAQRKRYIGDGLEYACQFWTKHLAKIPKTDSNAVKIQKAVDKFFTTHLLFWIEVLIVMGNLDISVHSINDVQKWYILVSSVNIVHRSIYSPLAQGGSTFKWGDDSQHFILEHFDTICNSPSQIYHSVLPLSPSSSWLCKCYSAEISLKVVKGVPAQWGACSHTVPLGEIVQTLSCYNNSIAIGSGSSDIIILDAVTGSQIAVLSGHTAWVPCLNFSSDGKSLVSGSGDKTVKLWDVQTGGVVKTFYNHTLHVLSVSISEDCTKIASESDSTVYLWDIQTGECLCTIKQERTIKHVSFSPMDPQQLILIFDNKIWQWDVDSHQTLLTYDGCHISFSPNCTQVALCNGKIVTIQNSDSRAIVAEFHVANDDVKYCCFSPDGRFVAAAAGATAYLWDIASPDPCLIETFIGHTGEITSLVFPSPSSLISASRDESAKFWKISTSSTDQVATDQVAIDPEPFLITPPSIQSVSLQTRAEIALSYDKGGVLKIWNLLTGLCKATFQIPAARGIAVNGADAQMIDGKLIFVWKKEYKIHILDVDKDELLQTLDTTYCTGLRISGDGSKVFFLDKEFIQALPIWTREPVVKAKLRLEGVPYLDSLYTDSSRVWIHSTWSSAQEGWDFGASPVPFDPCIGRPCLDFIGGAKWQTDGPSWIKDTATGKKVFQLSGRYARPNDVQWDGQYLIAGYQSGEVLILDFDHMYSQ